MLAISESSECPHKPAALERNKDVYKLSNTSSSLGPMTKLQSTNNNNNNNNNNVNI
jgi:hypothetical protein